MNKEWIVRITTSFDPECYHYKFDCLGKAKAFVIWNWEKIVNNYDGIDIKSSYVEDDMARIYYKDGDRIIYEIHQVDDLPTEFKSVDWKKYI